MVIVELIGSLSLAIAFVSVVTLTIIHFKNKQNHIIYIHDNHSLNNIEQSDGIIDQSLSVVPFQEFNQTNLITSPSQTTINKNLSIINVITNDEISSSPVKYGIQWALTTNKDDQSEIINSPSNILKTSQIDSLSFGDQTTNVRHLIEKFENNSMEKTYRKEKNDNPIDSDLTSINTNFDSQTIQTDLNQNQQKISHHSSISDLDIKIPSNLSSSIDLEQFECFSATSNITEFLNNN